MSSTAVVTGAGSGIGRAIAVALAERGATLVVTDVDGGMAAETAALLDSSRDQQHEFTQLDVTDVLDARRVADDVADRMGLDVWVNNAGISFMSPFLDMPLESVDRTFAVNLRGVYVCGQAAARAMVRTKAKGSIVNIASMAGKQGGVKFLADYVASKFGVVGLTQAMACELAPFGITVNSVCPGFVATDMQSRELGWEAELRGIERDAVQQMWLESTPLGRLEEPEDIARAVAFLVSPDARFITGEALSVNGGAFMD